MVDLANNWLTLLLPMMNWLIPKKYVKISKEEFDVLNIVKPTKNRAFWPAAGGSILFGVTFRKYTHLLDIQLEKSLVITICFITFLSILIFFMKLNQKLKLKVFNKNKEHKEKIMLLPTFKHFCFVLFSYLFSGFFFNNESMHVNNFRFSEYNSIYCLDYNDNAFLSSEYGFDR